MDGSCPEKKCSVQDLLYHSPYLEMDIRALYGGPHFKMMNQATHFIWQYLASHSHERGMTFYLCRLTHIQWTHIRLVDCLAC